MVATEILLVELSEAREDLTHVLANLDGSDEERVLVAHERGIASRSPAGTEYLMTFYVRELAVALAAAEDRISTLEQALAEQREKTEDSGGTKSASKSTAKRKRS